MSALDPHPSARALAIMFKRRTGRDLPKFDAEFSNPSATGATYHVRVLPPLPLDPLYVRLSEHEHQVALFAWAEQHAHRWPELRLLFAIANGGLRRLGVAGKLKAEGVKRGVPDMLLPVQRGGFAGLFIELKRIGGKPNDKQLEWRAELRQQGYRAEIVEGWHAARDLLIRYLDG